MLASIAAEQGSAASSRPCAIGRIARFIAMCAGEYFQEIGRAAAKRAGISASDDDGVLIGSDRWIAPSAPIRVLRALVRLPDSSRTLRHF
jgi:hypothetical protein